MIEISEVLYQWQQRRNKSQIAASLGITRPTLRKYLDLATAAGLTMVSSAEEVAAIALSVQASVAGGKAPAPARDAIAVHHDWIKELLTEPDMTARQVCRLLSESGHHFSERSVNRYVNLIAPA